MADKDLKSLTIGGTTYRNVYTDPYFGTETYMNTPNVTIPASTEVRGNSITLNDAGMYLVQFTVNFATASVTGTNHHNINIVKKVGGTETYATKQDWIDGTQYAVVHSGIWFVLVTSPMEIIPVAVSQRACTGSMLINALKVPRYPGLGGVMRHLKNLANSICYRPQFGKAVA